MTVWESPTVWKRGLEFPSGDWSSSPEKDLSVHFHNGVREVLSVERDFLLLEELFARSVLDPHDFCVEGYDYWDWESIDVGEKVLDLLDCDTHIGSVIRGFLGVAILLRVPELSWTYRRHSSEAVVMESMARTL